MDDRNERADHSKHLSENGNRPSESEGSAESTTDDRFATRHSATPTLGFVLQFTGSSGAEEFCGRVQDLATSDGGNFSSPDALIAILRRVLARASARARERSDE